MLSHFLRALILPPGCLLLALIAGLLAKKRYPRASLGLLAGSVTVLYLLSIPLVSVGLTRCTESEPAVTAEQIAQFAPQAIVILGSGVDFHSPEYGGATVPSESSLKRLAYGAYLAKQTGLPVLVTGGYGEKPEESESWAMRESLKMFGVPVRWMEGEGENTRENATFSAAALSKDQVKKILLVTSAPHAARAKRAFQVAGLDVLVAPTGFRQLGPWEQGLLQLVPTNRQLYESCAALLALFSQAWYAVTGS